MDRSAYDRNLHEEKSPTVQLFNYFNLDFFTSHNETDMSDGVVNVPESYNMDLNSDMELHSPLRLASVVPVNKMDSTSIVRTCHASFDFSTSTGSSLRAKSTTTGPRAA
jgi:hypothetical protein